MSRRVVWPIALSVTTLLVGPSAAAKSGTAEPSSGPPGTVVAVSGLDPCHDGSATFDTAPGPGAHYTASGSFTITVPADASDGEHWIWITCTHDNGVKGISAVQFTVTSAAPVRVQPALTG